MRLRRLVVSLAVVAFPVAAQRSESSALIPDVQLRVTLPGAFGDRRLDFAPQKGVR
jgi:hypothetical protein